MPVVRKGKPSRREHNLYKVTRLAKHRADPLPRPVCRTWRLCSLIPHSAGSFCLRRDPLLLRRQFLLLEKTQSPLPVLASGLFGEHQVPLPSCVLFLLLQFPMSPQRSSAVLSNSTPPFPTPMSAVEFLKPLLGGCSNCQGNTALPARGSSFILGSVPHATSFRIPPWVVVVSTPHLKVFSIKEPCVASHEGSSRTNHCGVSHRFNSQAPCPTSSQALSLFQGSSNSEHTNKGLPACTWRSALVRSGSPLLLGLTSGGFADEATIPLHSWVPPPPRPSHCGGAGRPGAAGEEVERAGPSSPAPHCRGAGRGHRGYKRAGVPELPQCCPPRPGPSLPLSRRPHLLRP